jgi:hypothetical protein
VDEVFLTEAEWRAVLIGARALRQVGAALSRSDARTLADECAHGADVLAGLARRAVVRAADLPTREEQAYAMYEALTDPLDEAERERNASVTGFADPSAQVIRAEFRAICAELGLPVTPDQGAELEAER